MYRDIMKRWWSVMGVVVVCVIAFAPGVAPAAENQRGAQELGPATEKNWQVGITPSYSSGNFGTNTTSEFVYVPTSIRRLFRDGDVTVVIPFVSVTSNGSATLVGGQPTPIGEDCYRRGGTEFRFDKPECVALLNSGQLGARQQKVTHSGLGDIILRGRYYAVEEQGFLPLIALTARIKVPTADEGKGLGTGALDHGYGVEMSKLRRRLQLHR